MYGDEIAKNLGRTLDELHKDYSNLDDDAKNTIRYYGVMYQSIRRFGTATEDSFNTTTGVLLKFQAEVENTKLALGNMVKPILTVVLPLLTTVLQWVQVLAEKIGNLFTSIAQMLGYEVTDLGANVDIDYNSNIAEGAEEDADAIKDVKTQLANIDEITKITNETESKGLDINLPGIEDTTEGILDIGDAKDKIKLPEWLQKIIDHLGVIKERLKPIIDDFKKIWEWIKKCFNELGGWDAILNAIADGIIWILDRLTDLLLLLWDAIKYAWELAKVFGEGFLHGLTGIDINDFLNEDGTKNFKAWWDKVCEDIRAKWERTVKAIKDIWQGLVDIFTKEYTIFHFNDDGTVKLKETFKVLEDLDTFLKQLAHTVGFTLGYAFDLLYEVVVSTLESIASYIKSRGDQIAYELHNIFTFGTDILKSFEDLLAGVRDSLTSFTNTLGTLLGNTLMSIAETALGFVEYCFGTLKKYLDQNGDYINQKLNSIFTVYESALKTLQDAVFWVRDVALHIFENEDAQQIGADLLAIFTDAWLNIREFWAKVNRDIINLIVQPFVENKGKILEAVDNFLAPVAQAFNSLKEAARSCWEAIQNGYDTYVAPAMQRLTEVLSSLMNLWLDMYNNYIAPVLQAWADKFDYLLEKAKPCFENIVQALGNIIELLANLLKFLEPIFEFVVRTLFPAIMPLIRGLGELVADVVGIIIDCITGLLEILNGILEFINGVFTLDWERCWNGVVEVFKGCWDIIKGIVTGLWNGIVDVFKAIIDAIVGIFKGLVDAVKNLLGIHSPSTVFAEIGRNMFQGLWNGISGMISTITNGVKNTVNTIVNNAKSMMNLNTLKETGKNLITGLWNGINDVKSWIIDKIKGFSNDIISKVKSFFGVHSPSKVFAWIGRMLMKGLGIGITSDTSPIKAINSMMDDSYRAVDNAAKAIQNRMDDIFNQSGSIQLAYAISNVPYISNRDLSYNLQELATGGIATSRTAVTVGEKGKEAILPLETNTEWMDQLASRVAATSTGNGDTTVVLRVNERDLGDVVINAVNNVERSSGKKVFNTKIRRR